MIDIVNEVRARTAPDRMEQADALKFVDERIAELEELRTELADSKAYQEQADYVAANAEAVEAILARSKRRLAGGEVTILTEP